MIIVFHVCDSMGLYAVIICRDCCVKVCMCVCVWGGGGGHVCGWVCVYMGESVYVNAIENVLSASFGL